MYYQRRKMLWRPAARMFVAGCMLILTGPGIGWANTELPKEPVLPLTLAQKAANAALAKCEEEKYKEALKKAQKEKAAENDVKEEVPEEVPEEVKAAEKAAEKVTINDEFTQHVVGITKHQNKVSNAADASRKRPCPVRSGSATTRKTCLRAPLRSPPLLSRRTTSKSD